MEVLWFRYSLDSNFKIENQQILSIDTFVRDPLGIDQKNLKHPSQKMV